MGARYERGLLDPDAAPGQSPFDHHVYVIASDGDLEEAAGRLDHVPFLDRLVIAVDNRTDGVFFEVEDLTHDRALGGLELEQFASHGVAEPVDSGDSVADLDDAPDLGDFELRVELGDFLLDD